MERGGNVNWAQAIDGRAAPGVSANVSLTYRLSPNWQILATYYDSRTGSWTPLTVVLPLAQPLRTPVPSTQERGVFLTFRYKREAGLHFEPLGGGPGAGSGELKGVVYLDANNNGQPDASEVGAANVTVVLDGRFSVQTDVNGRFDFPVVVTGRHVVQVMPDNLPLPWALTGGGGLRWRLGLGIGRRLVWGRRGCGNGAGPRSACRMGESEMITTSQFDAPQPAT